MTKKEYVIFGQSMKQSIFSDSITFVFLAFCIYISQGSNWWTFFTGVLFLIFMFGKMAYFVETKRQVFKTKKELMDWAQSLPDDE